MYVYMYRYIHIPIRTSIIKYITQILTSNNSNNKNKEEYKRERVEVYY